MSKMVCGHCGRELKKLTKHLAHIFGVKAPLCEKCNPHTSGLTEADREEIREILLGKTSKK